MLAALFNVPRVPRNPASLNNFSFNNDQEHLHIINAIQDQFGVTLDRYPLDPIPLEDSRGWARRHQIMHNNMNRVLGIQGQDLSSVDFTDERPLEAWIQIHVQEHYKANLYLNI